MIKKWRFSPFLKDIALTTVTSIATALSVIITTRLLAQGLGPEEFGAYSLARRVVSTIIPLSTLMMSIAVTRYVGISRDESLQYSYFLNGLVIGIPISLIILIIGLLNSNYLTGLIYHSQAYVSLFVVTLFMLVGISFYTVLSAFYRGQGKMVRFNLWQLGVTAFGPLAIAWVCARFGKSDLIILLLGGLFYVSLIPLSFHVVKAFSQIKKGKNIKMVWQLKELLRYGFPRTPGGIAFTGLLTIGPFLASYFGSMKEAGYLVIGQSIFRVVEGGMVAFGLVVLPKVAQIVAEGKDNFLKERITDVIVFVFHLGLFATLHLILWSDQIVILWLGTQYMEVILLMKVLLIALIPYLAHEMLRSIIDAVEERAVNTLNRLISLIAAFVFSVILARSGLGVTGLAIGVTLGFIFLGILSVLYLWKFYQINSNAFMIKKTLLLNTVFIVVAFFLKYCFEMAFRGIVLVAMGVFMESLFLFLYYLFFRKWSVRWTVELEKRIAKVR